MIIPLGTDRPPKRRPIVTELLIVTNLAVYLAGLMGQYLGAFSIDQFVDATQFQMSRMRLLNLVTYQFIHDPSSIWHLAFNMLFLWVFGSAVEGRLGRLGFLGFYLMGGAVAALAHGQLHPDTGVIGASGSISAVSGAFLALFPRSRIRVLFILFLGVISIPAIWFIGFFFVIDALSQLGDLLGRSSGVAYAAHLAGYVYGFSLAFVLLATGLLKRQECDVFFLFKQARRRATYRATIRSQAGGMFESASRGGMPIGRASRTAAPPSPDQIEQAERRAEIGQLIDEHELPRAAEKYRAMLERWPDATLAERHQVDVASQLYAEQQHRAAATAYELLLEHYPSTADAAEIRLILGIIYARKLDDPARARALIEDARPKLADAGQTSLADQLLAELRS